MYASSKELQRDITKRATGSHALIDMYTNFIPNELGGNYRCAKDTYHIHCKLIADLGLLDRTEPHMPNHP